MRFSPITLGWKRRGLSILVIFTLVLTSYLTNWPPFWPTVKKANAAWYSSNWTYRKSITIDHTKVSSSDQLNFPVLISWTSDANLSSNALSTGFDILFTQSDGTTKLSHEREKYVNSTGELEAWVNIPTLSSTIDTVIYLYYGNATSCDQAASSCDAAKNSTKVWDSNYQAVWHHHKDPSGVAPQLTDSTTNAVNGTVAGTWTSAQLVSGASGKIDGSWKYTVASSDKTTASNITALTSANKVTIEAWVNFNTLPGGTSYSRIFTALASSSDRIVLEECGTSDCGAAGTGVYVEVSNGAAGGYAWTALGSITTGTWYHLVLIFDGTQTGANNVLKLYLNGALQTWAGSSGTFTAPYSTSATSKPITMGNNVATGNYLDGTMDEIRVSNTTRTGGWATTEYNNQNSPSTFYSIGSQSINGPSTYSLSVASNINAGTCVAVTVTLNNPATGTDVIQLSSTSTGKSFYSNSSCTTTLTSGNLSITTGNTTAPAYIKDNSIGSWTLSGTRQAGSVDTFTDPGGISYTVSLGPICGASTCSTVTVSPSSVTTNQNTTVTITLTDAGGNPISGVPANNIIIDTTSGKTTATADVYQPTASTNGSGQTTALINWKDIVNSPKTVVVTISNVSVVGADGVTAHSGTLDSQPSVTVTNASSQIQIQGGTTINGGTNLGK